jgi:hypothetical protein
VSAIGRIEGSFDALTGTRGSNFDCWGRGATPSGHVPDPLRSLALCPPRRLGNPERATRDNGSERRETSERHGVSARRGGLTLNHHEGERDQLGLVNSKGEGRSPWNSVMMYQ